MAQAVQLHCSRRGSKGAQVPAWGWCGFPSENDCLAELEPKKGARGRTLRKLEQGQRMKLTVLEGEGDGDTKAAGCFWNPKYQAKESAMTGAGHPSTVYLS